MAPSGIDGKYTEQPVGESVGGLARFTVGADVVGVDVGADVGADVGVDVNATTLGADVVGADG